MKKKLHFIGDKCVLFLLVILFSQNSYSQNGLGQIDGGVFITPSNFLGDLGGNSGEGKSFIKDNNLSMTRLIIGAHVTVHPKDYLGIRLAFNYGNIAGDDAVIESKGGMEEARKVRNLNFKSRINEAYIAAEFYPTVFLEADPSETFHKIRPYGIAGVGVFSFNPQGQDPLTGDWVYLHRLHTEGQGFAEHPERADYKLVQMNVPFGAGLKYFAGEGVSIAVEILHRKTFTDYIDDVSTTYIDNDLFYKYLPLNDAIIANRIYDKSAAAANRNTGEKRGTSKNMDAYYTAGIKLSFRLGGNGSSSYLNSARCPVIRY
jgi:hypothetical protein